MNYEGELHAATLCVGVPGGRVIGGLIVCMHWEGELQVATLCALGKLQTVLLCASTGRESCMRPHCVCAG